MSEGLTPAQDAWLRSHAHREAFEDLSAEDINRMDMATFARLTGRATPTKAALQALDAQIPGTPRQESAPQPEVVEPQGVDIANMDMATYAQFRQEAGIGVGREYGNGILDAHGSWADAAKAKAGRSAMAGNRNTIEPPRLERYVRQGDHLDHRSAAERLSNPANMWQGR